MLAMWNDPKSEREPVSAGSRWKDDDLDEIMALLDKNYTKPQPKEEIDELAELKALLDKDYTKAEPEKAPHFPPLFGGGPILQEPAEEEVPAPVEKPVEGVCLETVVTTLGEQADFSDAPAKPVERKFPLVAIAVAELIALAAVTVWFLLWIG